MFDALRARLQALREAPQHARELAAARLTAECRTGHVEATGEGLRVVVHTREPFVSPKWAGIIDGSIRDALTEAAK